MHQADPALFDCTNRRRGLPAVRAPASL